MEFLKILYAMIVYMHKECTRKNIVLSSDTILVAFYHNTNISSFIINLHRSQKETTSAEIVVS